MDKKMDKSLLNGMLRDAKYKINMAFEKGYTQGMKDANIIDANIPSEKIKEAYENGLNDAWEAARKIYIGSNHGGLGSFIVYEIFGDTCYEIIKKFTASEAVKRIKEWEESQNKVKIGDVLHSKFDDCDGIVVNVEEGRYDLVQTNKHTCVVSESDLKNYWEKTDKHFDQIEEVLKKMQEDV